MGRIGLALKVLFSKAAAEQAAAALSEKTAALPETPQKPKAEPVAAEKPQRSEAITLLAALQREARFIDFVSEPIEGYADAQVGAAVRDIHRGCREVLDRMFALAPVLDQPEGSPVSLSDPSSGQYRLTGNVSQSAETVSGKLVHHGWKATKCEIPQWTGTESAARVVAPAEIEVE